MGENRHNLLLRRHTSNLIPIPRIVFSLDIVSLESIYGSWDLTINERVQR